MVGNNVTYKHRTYIVQNWAKITLPKLNNNQTRSVKKYEDDSLNQNPQIHRQHTYLNTPCLSFISSATDDLTKSRRRSILRKDALLNIIDIPEGTTGNEIHRKKHLHTQTASPGILTGFSKGALSSRMGWLDLQKKQQWDNKQCFIAKHSRSTQAICRLSAHWVVVWGWWKRATSVLRDD